MKRRALPFALAAVLLAACPLRADEVKSEATPKTKIEQFLSKRGAMILRDLKSLPTIEGPRDDYSHVSLSAIAAYAPGETVKIKGISVSGYRARGGGLSDDGDSFLDLEEVASLTKAIDFLTGVAGKWQAETQEADTQRDAIFMTKDDMEIGVTQWNQRITYSIKIGRIRPIKLTWITSNALTQLGTSLSQGTAWLEKQ